MHVTAPSSCSYLDHSVSGLIPRTCRPIKTRFRCAYTYRFKLARKTKSLTHYTKGTPSLLKEAPTVCRRPVSGSVSLPSLGCFSPFPHGTGSLSVDMEYLALEGGPPRFPPDFSCPAVLRNWLGSSLFRVRDYHPLWCDFPDASPIDPSPHCQPYNPDLPKKNRFGLFPFRSPLLGESRLISFPPGT